MGTELPGRASVLLGLRWVFLAAALVLLARFLLFTRSAEALALFGVSALAWAGLSRIKARSLDGREAARPW